MAIFRGIGGAGDSTTDATVTAVTEQATNAATSASEAASSASNAATSAANAATSETNAATSATNAAASETAASASETAAAASETAAAASETAAAASETAAAASETAAAASESAAATSETNAATSASAASTSASNASTSETNAASSASSASTSATNAATSATNAASSATSASTSATNAASSASSAAASYDDFDDRYLGAKASSPSLDNDGDALVTGALYFDTTSGAMKVYNGSSWLDAYASLSGALIATNNLADLADAATARTNLGVAIGTDVQAYSSVLAATTASFTTADETKLDGVEASADVTDAANVAAAGAAMDTDFVSEGLMKRGATSGSYSIVTDNSTNWNTAYGWGDHASAGYLTTAPESFPSGTLMLFQQTAAPTGWTKQTTHDNKALRVVTGTVGSGGSVAFTTAFASQAVSGSIANTTATNQAATAGGTVGSTTLTTTQIPSHNHRASLYHSITGWSGSSPGRVLANSLNYLSDGAQYTSSTGGGGSHNHSFSGSSHNHTQDAHNHTFTGTAIDLAVNYVDLIIASKD